ncbi:MAG TPA: hypothetical protein VNX68_06000 [Nitrosopumilaceae archaeon]|jgi:hypothetical protein|nr:hypothetical protein [Nitrosopumilaceae archaeon]
MWTSKLTRLGKILLGFIAVIVIVGLANIIMGNPKGQSVVAMSLLVGLAIYGFFSIFLADSGIINSVKRYVIRRKLNKHIKLRYELLFHYDVLNRDIEPNLIGLSEVEKITMVDKYLTTKEAAEDIMIKLNETIHFLRNRLNPHDPIFGDINNFGFDRNPIENNV